MVLGVVLILTSTVAYNGSVVLLAAAVRNRSGDFAPLAVSKHAPVLVVILLNVLGWVLEVAALTLIPLTLVRVLSVAGLGLLLVLTRRVLEEPLGRREISGMLLIALGVAAVGSSPPTFGDASPRPGGWALLLAILGPGVVLPYTLKLLRRPAGYVPWAVASGLAYALSGVFSKGAAGIVSSGVTLPLVLLVAGAAATGLWGFVVQLDALKRGPASTVAPIGLALHTVVPIVCAPFLFGETWPAEALPRVLLGGGILLNMAGTFMLAGSRSLVPADPKKEA